MNSEDTEPKKTKYTVDQLLEMLSGTEYYSMNQIMYVYHMLNEEQEEAQYYYDIVMQENRIMEKKLQDMKNRQSEKISNDSIYNDAKEVIGKEDIQSEKDCKQDSEER